MVTRKGRSNSREGEVAVAGNKLREACEGRLSQGEADSREHISNDRGDVLPLSAVSEMIAEPLPHIVVALNTTNLPPLCSSPPTPLSPLLLSNLSFLHHLSSERCTYCVSPCLFSLPCPLLRPLASKGLGVIHLLPPKLSVLMSH